MVVIGCIGGRSDDRQARPSPERSPAPVATSRRGPCVIPLGSKPGISCPPGTRDVRDRASVIQLPRWRMGRRVRMVRGGRAVNQRGGTITPMAHILSPGGESTLCGKSLARNVATVDRESVASFPGRICIRCRMISSRGRAGTWMPSHEHLKRASKLRAINGPLLHHR